MESMVWNKIEDRRLVSGGSWEDAVSTIRAKTFGALFEIASGRVKLYKSDLFHDAIWLEKYLTGPMQFDWIVRECGTFIGEVCQYVQPDEWAGSVRYRFEIQDRDRSWFLVIWQAGPVPNAAETVLLDM